MPPGVWEIGISMFAAADRGRGYGREAMTLICGRLFEREGADRVALTTDLDNAAMRAVAERCGFRFEGVLRSFMPSAERARATTRCTRSRRTTGRRSAPRRREEPN